MTASARWTLPEPLAVLEVRTLDGTSLFVRRHGNPDGPRIVVSHANGFSADACFPFWSHFIDRFDVFVHDVRNHGWSPVGDHRKHNVPAFADDSDCVVHAIDRRFGKKPRAGVFHSLSATERPLAPGGTKPDDSRGSFERARP